MALLRNLEQSLSGLVEGTVGRVFRTEVRPTEIARKLAREMEINKRVSLSRTYAPTDYIVYLSPEDRARYAGVEASIAEELGAYLLEHARRERLVLVRRPLVEFRTDQRLRLGEFGIEARTAPISAEEAPPRAEPQQEAQRRPQLGPEPEPAFEPIDEPIDEDPYAGDPFGGSDVAQPEDLVAPAPEPERYADDPEPAPYAPEPSHDGDWLDPVDDWDPEPAPAAPAQPEPAPEPPVAPITPRAPEPPAGLPWVDPGLRNTPNLPPVAPPAPMVPPVAAPPAAPPRPAAPPLRLLVDGVLQELHGDLAIIGRSRKSDVVIGDPSVSRQHVELRRDDQGWYAVDLGSTNGTAINGEPLTSPRRLAAGSRIEVGHASAVIEVR